NGDGDFTDFGDTNITWFVFLATGGVQVDLNSDGDFTDLLELSIGTTTAADTTAPTMPAPADITVRAAVSNAGELRAHSRHSPGSDGRTASPATRFPHSGSLSDVATTTVTCRARDEAGNVRTRTLAVHVQHDQTATPPLAPAGLTAIIVTA